MSYFVRIDVTEKAVRCILFLQEKYGPLIFHQSGGCCDGSAPMCYPKDELWINETDVLLGEICQCPFYMNKDQFEYWKHTHLTIDVVPGRGSGFSLEAPLHQRFVVLSRLFTEMELQNLLPVHDGNGRMIIC